MYILNKRDTVQFVILRGIYFCDFARRAKLKLCFAHEE